MPEADSEHSHDHQEAHNARLLLSNNQLDNLSVRQLQQLHNVGSGSPHTNSPRTAPRQNESNPNQIGDGHLIHRLDKTTIEEQRQISNINSNSRITSARRARTPRQIDNGFSLPFPNSARSAHRSHSDFSLASPNSTTRTARKTHTNNVEISKKTGERAEESLPLSADMFSAKNYSRPSSPTTFLTTSKRRHGSKSLRRSSESKNISYQSPKILTKTTNGFTDEDEARVQMLLRVLAEDGSGFSEFNSEVGSNCVGVNSALKTTGEGGREKQVLSARVDSSRRDAKEGCEDSDQERSSSDNEFRYLSKFEDDIETQQINEKSGLKEGGENILPLSEIEMNILGGYKPSRETEERLQEIEKKLQDFAENDEWDGRSTVSSYVESAYESASVTTSSTSSGTVLLGTKKNMLCEFRLERQNAAFSRQVDRALESLKSKPMSPTYTMRAPILEETTPRTNPTTENSLLNDKLPQLVGSKEIKQTALPMSPITALNAPTLINGDGIFGFEFKSSGNGTCDSTSKSSRLSISESVNPRLWSRSGVRICPGSEDLATAPWTPRLSQFTDLWHKDSDTLSISSKRSTQSVVSVCRDSGLKIDFARLHRAVTYEEIVNEFLAAKTSIETRGQGIASRDQIEGLLSELGLDIFPTSARLDDASQTQTEL